MPRGVAARALKVTQQWCSAVELYIHALACYKLEGACALKIVSLHMPLIHACSVQVIHCQHLMLMFIANI